VGQLVYAGYLLLTWGDMLTRRKIEVLSVFSVFLTGVGVFYCCCFYYSRNSLVALVEALFAPIYFRFEISVLYDHIFCFAFSKEKICLKKKRLV